MGAVLRERNALPTAAEKSTISTAKAAIDYCRAGRAAKSANPSLCAKNIKTGSPVFMFFYTEQ